MNDTKVKLQSLISEAVERLLSVLSDDLQNMSFGKIVETTQNVVNGLGTRIIEQLVCLADDIYYARRDKHKVILRNRKTRKMTSSMGEINLSRRLYYDKSAEKYFFAIDELLNIEKHSRIESGLKSKLISDATLTSYGKASKLSGQLVSRQTVYNLCRKVDERDMAARHNGYKKINEIYIEADEDHIHLKDGKSTEVKLIYVYEGRREVCNGRTELVNPMYFAAVSGGAEIWNAVSDYVYFQYNVPRAAIKISGDGANWIKGGLEVFPGAQYTLDKFHVYKSVMDASGGNAKFRKQVIDGIKHDDKNGVLRLYTAKWMRESTAVQRRRMADSLAYIDNNFDDIDLLSDYGCSAEGHVSHVLSARMSSRPMAWSEAGADKMAKLRAFYFNGGDFSALTWRKEPTEEKISKYNCFAFRTKTPTDHSIPCGRLLGLDMVYDEFSKALKFIIKR